MKIAQVITRSDTLGGASAHLRDLSVELMNLGHDVQVYIGGDGPVIKIFEEHGIATTKVRGLVRSLSPAADISAYIELKRLISNYQPDIVACHSAKAGVIGRLAAKSLQIPTVYTAHGWPFTDGVPKLRAFFYKMIERWMSRFTQQIITVSKYDRALALTNKIALPEQLNVVWNGIPDLSIKKNTSGSIAVECDKGNKANRQHKNTVHIAMVARFDKQKNFALLSESLSLIKELPWRASFVGNGPDLEKVRCLCRQLGIEDKVDFLGWCSDVNSILNDVDIFALISEWEGLPISILEAMSHGIPVIASDVGGVSEAVLDNETGILVPYKSAKQIATFLERLILEDTQWKKFGKNARLRYENCFTVERMTYRTVESYERAIDLFN